MQNHSVIAILVVNKFKFKFIKEKEGRYLIVKRRIEKDIVTLVNVYAPPDTNKQVFQIINGCDCTGS